MAALLLSPANALFCASHPSSPSHDQVRARRVNISAVLFRSDICASADIAFPASLALVVLRIPIVQLLLEHGAFASDATRAVGGVLGIYAFSVLADALCQPLWRVVYATRSGPAALVINSNMSDINR